VRVQTQQGHPEAAVDDARRFTVDNSGGGGPASAARWWRARAQLQGTPVAPLPNGGVAKTMAQRWEAATARVDSGGANLGLWAAAAQGR
jgi:hypothetical protein